ncbi:MAG: hypothetical protein M1401_01900 [Chloroflexi bacterium]|nr:hypothetical protein [Chloroflexota bacterium]
MARACLGLVLLLLALPAASAAAQAPQVRLGDWRVVGFEGSRVNALAVADEGRILYLATELGLQASLDGGENWNYIGQDLDRQKAPAVTALALDPRDPQVVYAGTERGAKGCLYVSRDGGLHWQRLLAGRREDGIRAIFVDPGDPQKIFVSTFYHDGTGDELLATADGGASWRTLLSDSDRHAQKFYQIARAENGRLLVASSLGSLAGDTADERFLNVSPAETPTYAIAGRPRSFGDRFSAVYVATQQGLTASYDTFSTWRAFASPPLNSCFVFGPGGLVVAPSQSPLLLASPRSLCQGTSAKVYALLAEPGGRRQVWQEVGVSLPASPEVRLQVAGEAQPRAYALTGSGLWLLDLPPAPAASATPAVDPPSRPPSGPVNIEEAAGEVKPTAVGSAIDYALWLAGVPALVFLGVRWWRRHG